MLYYRMYKRMKQKSGYEPSAFISIHFGLFAIIIPMVVGSLVGMVLEKIGVVNEDFGFFIMMLFVASGFIYIYICELKEKD